jgi:hypothetical protein
MSGMVSGGAVSTVLLKPKSLTANGTTQTVMYSSNSNAPHFVKLLSGALVANTYKAVLALPGPGVLEVALVCNEGGANGNPTGTGVARTLSVKIEIDGAVLVEKTVSFASGVDGLYGMIGLGFYNQSGVLSKQPVGFNSSCVVSIKCDQSETNTAILMHTCRLC